MSDKDRAGLLNGQGNTIFPPIFLSVSLPHLLSLSESSLTSGKLVCDSRCVFCPQSGALGKVGAAVAQAGHGDLVS